MKKLLLSLVVVVLLLSGCKYVSGPFGAKDGVVLCMVSGIDAEGKYLNDVRAFGGVSARLGSCNGDAYVADLTVRTRLWRVRTFGDMEVRNLCGDTGVVSIGDTSGFTIQVGGAALCGDNIVLGDDYYAETWATGWIGDSYYASAPTYSPVERQSNP